MVIGGLAMLMWYKKNVRLIAWSAWKTDTDIYGSLHAIDVLNSSYNSSYNFEL